MHAGEPAPPAVQFVGRMQTGTASWIDPFTEEQLDAWTARTLANSPYRDAKLDEASPLPKIEHVIYIVKENRTYDQVLGDMKEGNGDPSLVLFGENVTPNLHKLAREFVLLDNFYVNSDVSADGHNWSTAAIAPDYVQKMWPNKYANRRKHLRFRRAGRRFAAARRLSLDQCRRGRRLHAQLRLHGEQQARRGAGRPSRSPACATRCWPRSPTPCIAASTWTIPTWSAPRSFSSELAEYEKTGKMPRLIVMRLGNDHTSGHRRRQDRAALRRGR